MTTHDRERGTLVRRLDPFYLQQQALGHLKVQVPEAKWSDVNPVFRWIAHESPQDGVLYAVNTEGVGYKVGYGEPLAIDVHATWDHDGQKGTSQTEVYLSYYEVKQAMEHSDEDVDLADFVREFGDRLEANFSIWHAKFNSERTLRRTRKAAEKK